MARAGAHRGHGATRGAALAAMSVLESHKEIASAVTRTSTVASMRGGCAARGERCAASSARAGGGAARSAYRGWGRGCEGAIRAAPLAESGACRTRFATSALRGGNANRRRLATGDQPQGRGAWRARGANGPAVTGGDPHAVKYKPATLAARVRARLSAELAGL